MLTWYKKQIHVAGVELFMNMLLHCEITGISCIVCRTSLTIYPCYYPFVHLSPISPKSVIVSLVEILKGAPQIPKREKTYKT